MSERPPTDAGEQEPREAPDSRFQLIWDVVLFQFKLAADGLRDVLLMPVSLAAGVWGLIAGGDQPDQYFRRLQRFGRRTDVWINLFGQHRRGPTADNLVRPLEESLYREYQRWPERADGRADGRADEPGDKAFQEQVFQEQASQERAFEERALDERPKSD